MGVLTLTLTFIFIFTFISLLQAIFIFIHHLYVFSCLKFLCIFRFFLDYLHLTLSSNISLFFYYLRPFAKLSRHRGRQFFIIITLSYSISNLKSFYIAITFLDNSFLINLTILPMLLFNYFYFL